MKKLVLFLLAAALILSFNTMAMAEGAGDLAKDSALVQIQKAKKLRVGLEAGYMPFEMRNKRAEIIGFDVDIAKKMAEAMGVELEVVNTAWDGIIGALITKKFDIIMSGMTITQKRNLQINFCDPYIIVGQTALVGMSSTRAPSPPGRT